MRFFLMSNHVNFVAHDDGQLIQAHASADHDFVTVEMEGTGSTFSIKHGPLAGFTVTQEGERSVSLKSADGFLCANEGVAVLEANRPIRSDWETFYLAGPDEFRRLKSFNLTVDGERARFRKRVSDLTASQSDVKIYCGCGRVPKNGWINLDIRIFAPAFSLSNPEDYFIFDFAGSQWPLEDSCVDIVFDEDFIEHIDQITQVQYLAETRRVLKTGSFHRVNTPNFLTSMKRHSDFARGAEGVYTGEREHEHIAMLSPWSLKELSELVGYRDIVFTSKNVSVSPYLIEDTRPWSDRDPVLGNIFAELLK